MIVLVFGLLVWGYTSLGIYVPRVHVVHLETAGGPVPIKVVFLDPRSAYIEVGHDGDDSRMLSGPDGDFRIHDVQWSPFEFEIEFPRDQATLTMTTIEAEDGTSSVEGVLAYSDDERVIEEIPARSMRVVNQNWFDLADTDVPTSTDRNINGNWVFKSSLGSEVARIRLDAYTPKNFEMAQAEAEVLTFLSEHRHFVGVITSNRILLASFDNAYPALIDATIQDDGTLNGDLWVGDRLHESFVGTRE
ncbi:MAG: hypothetical protein KDA29_04330 [Phycisphaerales bacterium]|nr:hypothetical protein [Phycisphaerales bacterium]